MTFLEAALEILKRERRPLHFKELTEKATERKLLTFVGRTPEVTMQTQLTGAVKKAPGNPFVRVKPGVFGLLRYPEAPAEPEPEPTPEKPQKSESEKPQKSESEKPQKSDSRTAEGEARGGRRRRRGGRGRRRGRGDAPSEAVAPSGAAEETASEGGSPVRDGDEREGGEVSDEPQSGSLSPEARAAALAESGVLEGDGDERDAEEQGESEALVDDSRDVKGESGDRDEEAEAKPEETGGGRDEALASAGESAARAEPPGSSSPPPGPSDGAAPAASPAGEATSATPAQPGRKITSPIDAAIEILRGQSPGRGLHVRQIADAAVRRRLIHGEPNEAWRVMRAALAAEGKERLRAGQRPRVRSAGSGLYALARRPPDSDLERAELVLGEARRALRERTLAALEQRLAELSPAAFEAVARVLLQREGFGPATFVKRVEGTIYLEALRGRGFRPSRCLIALRAGPAAAGRRAMGELRAGIRARNQDEGVLVLAGRLADDAIAEWKQSGAPVEVVDGPAMAETCVRHGIGVIGAVVNVEFVDADFFAEISEG
jgi:hypothetical protein